MARMTMAQDKRTIDQDGRLRVPGCKISKANVCPYLGREIPDYQALGLNPDRIYRLYRDPQALAQAASTFNDVPLTVDHILVSADDFPSDRVGGTVSNARYEHPYLVADVTVWTQGAIDGINDGERKELSCAYRYVASMIPGTSPDGVRFDGRMIGPIQANHVALVEKGRAGPDVVIADGALRMTMKRPAIVTALAAILSSVATPEQMAALDSALDKELTPPAADALSEEEMTAARDAYMKELGCDSLTEEQTAEAYARAAKDKKAPNAATEGRQPSAAVDAATIQAAIDAAVLTARDGYLLVADADKAKAEAVALAVDAARAEVHALYTAREAVAEKCGVVALDSAEAVYRFALDQLKIPHADVPAAALAALYAGVKSAPTVAKDSAPPVRVTAVDCFPNVANIRR
jgi:hypothetical protein